jgi:hypothetical protein
MSTVLLTLLLVGYDSSRPLCEKWTWQGPPYNRKVKCLKWQKNNDQANKGKRK